MEPKGSILIVDDNEGLCRSLALILKRRGYDVTTAFDGTKAVQLSGERAFDLIFMDIRMPNLNGVEAFKQVRSTRPDTVVMMMTAFEHEALIQEALDNGALGVLNKPFEMDRMLRIVEGVCTRRRDIPVLVVDDDESTRATLRSILTTSGYRVEEASTGEEAVEMVKDSEFQIAFIDMKLPGLNGLETYLEMKTHDPGITAIIITGFHADLVDLVEQAILSTAFTCLEKPLDMDRLLSLTVTITWRKLLGLPMSKPGSIPMN